MLAADALSGRDLQLAQLFRECSIAEVPLRRGRGARSGVLVLAYGMGREPGADALGHLLTVGQLAADALVSSVARNRALPALTSVLVPDLADWAAAHLVEPDRTFRLVSVQIANPHRRGELREVLVALHPTLDDRGSWCGGA